MNTRRVVALLALLELAIAVYLEIERARGRSVACPIGGGGCETVQKSRYSHLAGVPTDLMSDDLGLSERKLPSALSAAIIAAAQESATATSSVPAGGAAVDGSGDRSRTMAEQP